jgi:hypothetical protein
MKGLLRASKKGGEMHTMDAKLRIAENMGRRGHQTHDGQQEQVENTAWRPGRARWPLAEVLTESSLSSLRPRLVRPNVQVLLSHILSRTGIYHTWMQNADSELLSSPRIRSSHCSHFWRSIATCEVMSSFRFSGVSSSLFLFFSPPILNEIFDPPNQVQSGTGQLRQTVRAPANITTTTRISPSP